MTSWKIVGDLLYSKEFSETLGREACKRGRKISFKSTLTKKAGNAECDRRPSPCTSKPSFPSLPKLRVLAPSRHVVDQNCNGDHDRTPHQSWHEDVQPLRSGGM